MEKESFRGKEPAVKQLGGRVGGGRSITFLRTAFAHSQEKERKSPNWSNNMSKKQ